MRDKQPKSREEQDLVERIMTGLKDRWFVALAVVIAIGLIGLGHTIEAVSTVEAALPDGFIALFRHYPAQFSYPGSPGGRYVKDKATGEWLEYANDSPDPLFHHKEFKQDKDYIYLIDTSRHRGNDHAAGTYTRLPVRGGQAEWSYPNPINWVPFLVVTPN